MNNDKSKVCVIIVTYGNRWDFVDQVVENLKKQSVKPKRVVIVDNGSTKRHPFKESSDFRIEVVELDKNYGSAGGYKRGMEYARTVDCDLVWLLDCDNRPQQDALEKLLVAREYLGNDDNSCFASLRTSRGKYVNAAFGNTSVRVIPNSFMRFALSVTMRRLAKALLRIPQRRVLSVSRLTNPIKRIEYAIFGGLLLSKKWIDKIGYPDEDYFVYMDDVDYTTRIVRAGGNIYLVGASIIIDIDDSWRVKSGKKLPPLINLEADKVKVYYSVRNNVFLENQYFVNSKIQYYSNMTVLLVSMFVLGVIRNRSVIGIISRFRLVVLAIVDGLNKNMGPAKLR